MEIRIFKLGSGKIFNNINVDDILGGRLLIILVRGFCKRLENRFILVYIRCFLFYLISY